MFFNHIGKTVCCNITKQDLSIKHSNVTSQIIESSLKGKYLRMLSHTKGKGKNQSVFQKFFLVKTLKITSTDKNVVFTNLQDSINILGLW